MISCIVLKLRRDYSTTKLFQCTFDFDFSDFRVIRSLQNIFARYIFLLTFSFFPCFMFLRSTVLSTFIRGETVSFAYSLSLVIKFRRNEALNAAIKTSESSLQHYLIVIKDIWKYSVHLEKYTHRAF